LCKSVRLAKRYAKKDMLPIARGGKMVCLAAIYKIEALYSLGDICV